jgi:hypothetical protein
MEVSKTSPLPPWFRYKCKVPLEKTLADGDVDAGLCSLLGAPFGLAVRGDVASLEEAFHVLVSGLERLPRLIDPASCRRRAL